ncbi:uncharacterized protein [Manis javanica]|uniref:uncharacterized protein isoform X1 n=1 Tax=Manis javanica TaxID=9974 RepID=UPI003C6D5E5C
MRSCFAEPSEGVGVREAERESLPARCGRWLSGLLHRLCPCLPRSPEREPEPTRHGTEVPRRRAPRTGVRRKGRKRTARMEPAPNTSRGAPEATHPPEDADQPTTDQRLPRSQPGSVTGDALTASSCNGGHDGSEEELKTPRMGRAGCLAWEPERAPSVHLTQLSSTLVGQVLHHLVQEEHLGPTVAELEDPRHMQLAPETRAGPAAWLEPVRELPETPVLERREVSPASAAAEPEDVPAVASAQGPGPELEPHEPAGLGPRAPAGMAPGVAEPGPDPEPASPWDILGGVSGPELEPHETLDAGPVAPAGTAQGLAKVELDPEPTSPCAVSTRNVLREDEPPILVFPPRLVGQQLSLRFLGLYKDILECKKFIQDQPQMGDTGCLAPTIQRLLMECDTLINVVTTTCLMTPSMMAQERARVVEFWIWVAMESLSLRNHIALRAILSALQRPAIHRLHSTWGHVSCVCLALYEKLKTRDNWVHRKRLFKEMTFTLMQMLWDRMGPDVRKRKGMVPYLGLILYDFVYKHLENDEEVSEPRGAQGGRMVSFREERASVSPDLSAPGHPHS